MAAPSWLGGAGGFACVFRIRRLQKFTRAWSTMIRAPEPATGLMEPIDDEAPAPTPVIRPKLVLLMVVLGFPKMGVLVTFCALAPIWKLNRSLILKRFTRLMFRFFE